MGISVIGGASTASGPSKVVLEVGTTGNKTFSLESEMPAGDYTISNTTSTTVFDIYLVDSSGASVGYTSSTKLQATKPFTKIVLFGAPNNSVFTLDRFESETPETTGDVTTAGPFIVSATPLFLPNVNDATTVSGGNFATNVQVSFRGTNNVEYPAKSVTRTSSTSLSAVRPDTFDPAFAPYDLIVVNPGVTNPTATNSHILQNTIGVNSVDVTYLVIAGGGGGGFAAQPGGGAGGAGGYITSVAGEFSGGGAAASSPFQLLPGVTYNVTVGAGGGGAATAGLGGNGSSSSFHTVSTVGGGGGAGGADVQNVALLGNSGGSGGSHGYWNTPVPITAGSAGTAGQGYASGGINITSGSGNRSASGGGGAGAVGADIVTAGIGGNGGIGVLSTITGTSVRRGGGGGGSGSPTRGLGGDGGGGNGAQTSPSTDGTAGAANTGGGGGGGGCGTGFSGKAGGSGVVILRYPSTWNITATGLTASTTTNGGNKITTITAGTGTVSWA